MPEILPANQILTIQAKTQSPSARVAQQAPSQSEPSKEPIEAPKQQSTEPATENVPRETAPKEEDKSKVQFAALSKKERILLQRDRELKALEKQLQEKESRYKGWEEAAVLAQTNKLEAIKRLGITYDDLTNIALGQSTATPEQIAEMKAQETVQKQLAEFRKEQEQYQITQQQRAYEQARQQIAAETRELATIDNFPLVHTMKAEDTVVELIEQTFHETGKVMSVEAAIKEVEQYLEEKALEIAKLEKIRSKVVDKETKPEPAIQQVNQQPTTLTHKSTVAPAAPTTKQTSEERRRRAIEVFYGRG